MSYSISVLLLTKTNLQAEMQRLEDENRRYIERIEQNLQHIEDLNFKIIDIDKSLHSIDIKDDNG